MHDDFLNFLKEPTKEAFLKARTYVIEHEDYNPYSDDISTMQDLLQEEAYQQVLDYHNINIILSPRAHILKRYAATQLEDKKASSSEHFLGIRILEGIEATGDGSKENPYMVLRVNDERDFLSYIGETYEVQALIKEDTIYDMITTESGKTIYFDITTCYKKMETFSISDLLGDLDDDTNDARQENKIVTPEEKKKWWKFWS